MYARCTGCGATLAPTPAHLAEAGGVVRCGSCGKTFNALANLFDHPPTDDQAQPLPAGGMPPLIPPRAAPDGTPPAPEPEPGPRLALDLEPAPVSRRARILWPAAALVLLALAVLQVAGPESWRVPLPGLDSAADPPPGEAIEIVSRDLHAHPTVAGAVVVSAVLANRADRTIAYPVLEVRLYDASQQPVARRRFEPAEYLDETASLDRGLQPDVLLPVVLELATEGTSPTGFQFLFYD